MAPRMLRVTDIMGQPLYFTFHTLTNPERAQVCLTMPHDLTTLDLDQAGRLADWISGNAALYACGQLGRPMIELAASWGCDTLPHLLGLHNPTQRD